MSGALYVVATPIGNLEDWTDRARRVIGEADLLLAEDTRHTRRLLNHYGIRVPLESYHDFNETARAGEVLERLQSGARIALVSDQGTPTVSDPGYRLIRLCRDEGVPVLPIPGPSAVTAALSVSGLPTNEFYFVGFLPARKEARRRRIEMLRTHSSTLVFYEAPHRLLASLADMAEILGNRTAFLAREMTKVYEEYLFGPISEIASRVKPRGEVVIAVEGSTGDSDPTESQIEIRDLPRPVLLREIARRLGVGRRELYEALYKK